MSQGFDNKTADAHKIFPSERKLTEVADIGCIQKSLVQHFQDIKDPRVERTKKHQLTDILVIAILAVIAGAQGWEDMENYGISKKQWLEKFLALPHGIPSDDTFRRVFEFINPEELNRCFLQWVETLVTKMGGEIIPIDGKTIRGSYDRNQGKSALHIISAWSSEQLSENIGVLKTRLIGLLTVHSRSDACRIRSFHSPRNFALLRRIALNALNRELTYKRSLRQKMKRTAMDNDYMIQVLSSCFLDPTLDSSESLCQA